jgi:H2-forming N5,N10-methylenetetrahydromethanopterin dehydrogenase-like enzyme
MRSTMKVLGGMTCPESFGDDLIPYSSREMRLKEASHDLRMAMRCIRELSKTAGVSKAV